MSRPRVESVPVARCLFSALAWLLALGALAGAATPAKAEEALSAADLHPVPPAVVQELRASIADRNDSCRVDWTEPYYYLWEWAQARCEATRCELTTAQTISTVGIVLYNYGSAPAEKPLRVFLLEDAAGMPGATLWSLETTTTLLAAGETKTVLFTVDPPVEILSAGPVWFGHQEYASGPPSSLFDGVADAAHASSTAPCGAWSVQDLGDYLQYLPAEIPSGVPGPTGSPSGLVARFRSLSQPVRDEIRLELELTRPATTSLDLFAFSGRRVGTLLAGEQLAAGTTVHRYDAAGIPSGLYLLRLEAGGERVTRKVLVLH